jgi:hypothetical protein
LENGKLRPNHNNELSLIQYSYSHFNQKFGKWQSAPQPQQRTIAHPLQLLALQSKSVIRMPASIVQTMTHASISAVVLFTTFEQVRISFFFLDGHG